MTAAALLALSVLVLPRGDTLAAARYANAIAATDATRVEAVELFVISAYENGWRHGVPFGACHDACATHCSRCNLRRPLVAYARSALASLRVAETVCGVEHVPIAVRLGVFHSGRCRADAWSRREARAVARAMSP